MMNLRRASLRYPYPATLSAADYINEYKQTGIIPEVADVDSQNQWHLSRWRDIRVGDFILLQNNDEIPADILIVSSSEPNGSCYLETKNLDGETNLKIKKGVTDLENVKTPELCANMKCYIDAEIPNENLYTFQGAMNIINTETKEQTLVPIGPSGVLLRGCILRNTAWVVGLAIYTGADTKIMLNSGPTPSKRSRVDNQINPQVILNAFILFCLCVVAGLSAGLFSGTFKFSRVSFAGLFGDDNPFLEAFTTFFRSLIVYQNIIPIALFISLEVTKTMQVKIINSLTLSIKIWKCTAKRLNNRFYLNHGTYVMIWDKSSTFLAIKLEL